MTETTEMIKQFERKEIQWKKKVVGVSDAIPGIAIVS